MRTPSLAEMKKQLENFSTQIRFHINNDDLKEAAKFIDKRFEYIKKMFANIATMKDRMLFLECVEDMHVQEQELHNRIRKERDEVQEVLASIRKTKQYEMV